MATMKQRQPSHPPNVARRKHPKTTPKTRRLTRERLTDPYRGKSGGWIGGYRRFPGFCGVSTRDFVECTNPAVGAAEGSVSGGCPVAESQTRSRWWRDLARRFRPGCACGLWCSQRLVPAGPAALYGTRSASMRVSVGSTVTASAMPSCSYSIMRPVLSRCSGGFERSRKRGVGVGGGCSVVLRRTRRFASVGVYGGQGLWLCRGFPQYVPL